MTLLETMVYHVLIVMFIMLWYAWLSDMTGFCERWWHATRAQAGVCYAFQVLARDLDEGLHDPAAWHIDRHTCGWHLPDEHVYSVYKNRALWRYGKRSGGNESRMVLVQGVDECEFALSGDVVVCSLVYQGQRSRRAFYRMSKVWPCSYLLSSSALG